MIVCSCRALSDAAFRATLDTEHPDRPRTAAQAYRCLGARPDCGRCLRTVRAILDEARALRGTCCGGGCQTSEDLGVTEPRLLPVLMAAE